MENRVLLLNGGFSVISEPGKGCTIVAFFPLSEM
jgi:signal transduction histidine kinase